MLTVLLKSNQTEETEPSHDDETGTTIETISLNDPTDSSQNGNTQETDPSVAVTDPTAAASDPADGATDPASPTTEPSRIITEPAAEPTDPADGGSDGDSVDGGQPEPPADVQENVVPIRGMLLVPLRGAESRTMTFVIDESTSYDMSGTAGERMMIDTPYRNGYSFRGWTVTSPDTLESSQKTALETQANNGSLTVPDYNVIFTANWVESGITSDTGIYTIQYWLDDPDTGAFPSVPYRSVVGPEMTAGSVYTLTEEEQAFPDTSLAPYIDRVAGDVGPKTIKGDNTTVFALYFKRKTYTVNFNIPGIINGSQADWTTAPVISKNSVSYSSTYTITARYDQNVEGLWPEHGDVTTNPVSGGTTYEFGGVKLSDGQIIRNNPCTLSSAIVSAAVQEYSFPVNWETGLKEYKYRISLGSSIGNEYYYLYLSDGTFESNFITPKLYPEFEGYEYKRYQKNNGNKYSFTLYYNAVDSNKKFTFYYANSSISSKKLKPGTSVNRPSNPSRSGYTFIGWYDDPEFSVPVTWPVVMPAHDKYVYALWEKNNTVYHMVNVYACEGGASLASEVKVEDNQTVPTTAAIRSYSREGFRFVRWYTLDETNQRVDFVFNSTLVTKNLNVYGEWEEIPSFTVSVYNFEGAGNSRIALIENIQDGDVVPASEEPSVSRDYYEQSGWKTSGGAPFVFGTTAVTADTIVYGVWTPKEYKLTVHKNNGDDPETLTIDNVPYGRKLNELGIVQPDRTGYDFDAWYTEQTWTETYKIDWATHTMPGHDQDIYANWNRIYCTVHFWDGTNNFANPVIEYGNTINRSFIGADKEMKDGFVFNGWWYTDSTGEHQLEFHNNDEPDSGTKITSREIDVRAKWNEIYKVTFLKDKGTSSPSNLHTEIEVEAGNKIPASSIPENPTKADFTFKEWVYMDGEDEKVFTFGDEGTVVNGNMTLYPGWTENLVDLVINNGGGDNVFILSGNGINLNIFIPAEGSVTVPRVPFGTYSVTRRSWDYRRVSAASVETEAGVDNLYVPLEVNFGKGNFRNLNWLGYDVHIPND